MRVFETKGRTLEQIEQDYTGKEQVRA
jgi:hypothetical protein